MADVRSEPSLKPANVATLVLRGAVLLALFSAFSVAQEGLSSTGVPITIEKIDGTIVEGRWAGAEGRVMLTIETASGALQLRTDELASVLFSRAPGDRSASGAVFHLADGGRLTGELLGSDGDALLGRTSFGPSTRLPFERLAGVELARRSEYPEAANRFTEALAARLPAKDVLITREVGDVKTVRGRLESLDPASGNFALGAQSRSFTTEKIFGIVFASGSGRESRPFATLRLRDGVTISGMLEGGSRDRLAFATSLGFTAELRLDRLLELVVHSPRVVYVTDLPIEHESGEGRLHASWAVAEDRSAGGGPLRIDGRTYERGLGMHSKGEVGYSLGGEYELFVATIGLDDAVRPRGSVVFKVLGDGRELFDSGLLTGTDPSRSIRVPVNKVQTLTLVVGYGDGLDLSDYADWGNARLIKPREES